MKFTRLLTLAALGTAVGYYLTRTQQGRQLRSDLTDRAVDLGDKFNKMRRQTAENLTDYAHQAQGNVNKGASELAS